MAGPPASLFLSLLEPACAVCGPGEQIQEKKENELKRIEIY
jgi:hypothetical protein